MLKFSPPVRLALTSVWLATTFGIAAPAARAQYSSQQFLRDTRVYTANLLDSLRSTPNSTYNSPYKFGTSFAPVYKQKSDRWNRDYDAPKPLTYEEKERLRREKAAQELRLIQFRAAEAEKARREEIARKGQIEFDRIMAERAAAERTETARRLELERRAEGGDYAAIVQSAKEASVVYRAQVEHIIRAAKAGDRGSISRLASYDQQPSLKDVSTEAERATWHKAAEAIGDPETAFWTAAHQDDKGDTRGALQTQKAAYAIFPSARTALEIVKYASKLSLPDEAAFYLKEAVDLDTAGEYKSDIAREVYGVPVNRQTAPLVLGVLEKAAEGNNDAGSLASLRLGDIYAGQDASWHGLARMDPKYRAYYQAAAEKSPEHYVAFAADRFAQSGDFDQAERLFQTMADRATPKGFWDNGNVFAAADFWRTRTDGKADGNKAAQLYARVAENGDLSKMGFRRIEVQMGDMYWAGQGLAPDKAKAVEWYQKGRATQNIAAIRRLAALTWAGDGVPKNEDAALQMLQEATTFNTTDFLSKHQAKFDALQLRMGRAIATSSNYKEAFRALESDVRAQAAESSEPDPRAIELLGRALVAGDAGSGDAQAKAEGWALIERAALLDLPSSKTLIGLRLLAPGSKPTSGDAERAFDYFFDAAKSGDAGGGYGLGLCYQNGYGISADAAQAKQWFGWALERGYAPAKAALVALNAPKPLAKPVTKTPPAKPTSKPPKAKP